VVTRAGRRVEEGRCTLGIPPGSSSSTGEGRSMAGIDEPLTNPVAPGEQHFPMVWAGGSG
jgi:hypothetical protein